MTDVELALQPPTTRWSVLMKMKRVNDDGDDDGSGEKSRFCPHKSDEVQDKERKKREQPILNACVQLTGKIQPGFRHCYISLRGELFFTDRPTRSNNG